MKDSGKCHDCKNEENNFQFSEWLRTNLNLLKHSLILFQLLNAENVMKYLTVIYNGNAFRWLFLQIKTVQILLQFVLSLIFPIYANFTNYCANLNLYTPPHKSQINLKFWKWKQCISRFAIFVYIITIRGRNFKHVCLCWLYLFMPPTFSIKDLSRLATKDMWWTRSRKIKTGKKNTNKYRNHKI